MSKINLVEAVVVNVFDLARRGVIRLARGQLVGTSAGVGLAAVGLAMASPFAGVPTQLEPIAVTIRLASVGVLATAAGVEARSPGKPYGSGWPDEGVLLFGAAVVFTAAILGVFVWLAAFGAASATVLQTFLAMLILGNVFLGACSFVSFLNREKS
ncbi:MAG: hypothetical protein ABMA14_15080 [Hyphomonadaceae bacterium]